MPIVIIGVTLSSLHQSTLGTLYLAMPHRLHPFWYTPLLPLQFFTSSIMVGLSVALLMYVLASKIHPTATWTRKVVNGLALGAAWSGVVYLVLKVGDVIASGELAAIMANTPMARISGRQEGLLGVVLDRTPAGSPAASQSQDRAVAGAVRRRRAVQPHPGSTLFAQMAPSGYASPASSLEWVSSIGVLSGVALAWYLAVKLPAHPAGEAQSLI